MIKKAGVIWDCDCYVKRYICENDILCELITPQMLATPFYRGKLVSIIIPTGFGNPAYSGLMPALRGTSARIRKFVEKGGTALVFGAMSASGGCYDWLPFEAEYVHEYFSSSLKVVKESDYSGITSDFDESGIECDGYFSAYDGDCVIMALEDRCVLIEKKIGDGRFIITSVHEFPSKEFLVRVCSGDSEIIF